MRLRLNLNLSVALAMILLVTVVSGLFAVSIAYVSEQLQHALLNEIVDEEASELIAMLKQAPDAPITRSVHEDIWVAGHPGSAPVPPELEALPIGTHHDIRYGKEAYHLLRTELDGRAVVVAFHLSQHNTREFRLRVILALSALLAPAAVLGVAFYLSRRITGPVVQLSDRLNRLEPAQRHVRLSSDFRGREVEQIAQAFDRYQERLDQFVEREQAFSAAAGHELRTPLATVAGAAEVLGHERELPERLQNIVRRMLRATQQMSDLLTGLMWLARERETHPTSELDLKEELCRVIEDYQPFAEKKGIRLEGAVNTNMRLMLPVGHVAIVVSNLLRNAIHHTPSGGLIRVHAEGAIVTVQDTGRGIEPRHLHRIFDKDFRGADSPGAGLGLFITQRICLQHGWPMTVDSTPGQGTTVRLHLLPAPAAAA